MDPEEGAVVVVGATVVVVVGATVVVVVGATVVVVVVGATVVVVVGLTVVVVLAVVVEPGRVGSVIGSVIPELSIRAGEEKTPITVMATTPSKTAPVAAGASFRNGFIGILPPS